MADIYDEVLADRKKLLEVAEKNAKDKILSAVTPRIKELVENAILGKLNEDMPGDDEDIILDTVDDDEGAHMDFGIDASTSIPGAESIPGASSMPPIDLQTSMPAPGANSVSAGEPAGLSLPDMDGKVTLDIDSLTQPQGGQMAMPFELTPESIKALNALIGVKQPIDLKAIEARTSKMESIAKDLMSLKSPSVKDRELARQLKVECQKIFSDVQQTRDFLDEAWARKIETKLEKAFHVVMERFSAMGHISAIIKEMVAINKAAGSLNKIITESRALTNENFGACVKLLRSTQALHDSVRRLHESLGKDDDSVDSATVRQVGANLTTLYVEIRKMVTKKGKQINEADELDVGGDDVADVDGDAAGVDAEKMLVQLELPASLKDIAAGDQVSVVDVAPAGEEDVDGAEAGMDAEMGDEDLGGLDDLEGDLSDDLSDDLGDEETNDEEAGEGMAYESDGDMYEAKLNDDDIIEIDEAALVAEMRNMKKLREKKYAVRHGGHGPGDLSDFGGGKGEGEKFVDGQDLNQGDELGSEGYLEEGDEDDLDEADALEEEDYGVSGDKWSKKQDRKEMGESLKNRQGLAKKNGRANESQLAEAFEKARAELAESKLFNTKLVALNRVLQIPGLRKAQKEKIVEVLDKGRTVAEVQQLYGKIIGALKKDAGSITETADKSSKGSSSRVTGSTSPSDKGEGHPLLEKWNKIAFGGNGPIQG